MRALPGATHALGLGLALGLVLAAVPSRAVQDGADLYRLFDPPRATTPGQRPMDAAAADASALEPGRSRVEVAWFDRDASDGQRVNQARIASLHLGIPSLDDAARALLGAPGREVPLDRALLAVRLAPDLPYAHVALARAYWAEGHRGKASDEWEAALRSLPRSLEGSLWAFASGAGLVALVLVGASLLTLVLVSCAPLASTVHDLGDLLSREMPGFGRGALLGALLLVPLLLGEGPLGLVLALFVFGYAYGGSRGRVTLAAAAALTVLGLFPVSFYAGKALGAMGADPVADAALETFSGSPGPAELRSLIGHAADDPLAASALAARARQRGRVEEVRYRYRDLLQREPDDPVLLNNAANLLFEEGRTAPAIDLYERSARHLSSTGLLFNLSQAYGRSFRMEDLESALRSAQDVDPELLLEFTQARDANLVVDLPPDPGAVRWRLFGASDGEGWARALRARIAPGWLGARWLHLAGAFAGAAVLGLLLARVQPCSARCPRCGARQCPRCDSTAGSHEACPSCRRLFLNPGGTDPNMRVARMNALRRRQLRIERAAAALSLLVPGAAGLAARRPDLVLVGALVGGWAIAAGVARHGLVPDPLVVGGLGTAIWTTTALLAAVGHLGIVALGLRLRRSA